MLRDFSDMYHYTSGKVHVSVAQTVYGVYTYTYASLRHMILPYYYNVSVYRRHVMEVVTIVVFLCEGTASKSQTVEGDSVNICSNSLRWRTLITIGVALTKVYLYPWLSNVFMYF